MKKSLAVDQGASFTLDLRAKDEEGVRDLTGGTATFVLYTNCPPGDYRQAIETDETGNINFAVDAEDTAKWPGGRRNYRVFLTMPSGTEVLLRGTFLVRAPGDSR